MSQDSKILFLNTTKLQTFLLLPGIRILYFVFFIRRRGSETFRQAALIQPRHTDSNRVQLHLEGWVMLHNMLYNRGGVISHTPVI
jgi:hypothetical protein